MSNVPAKLSMALREMGITTEDLEQGAWELIARIHLWDSAGHDVPSALERAVNAERRADNAERELWLRTQTDDGQAILKLEERIRVLRERLQKAEEQACSICLAFDKDLPYIKGITALLTTLRETS